MRTFTGVGERQGARGGNPLVITLPHNVILKLQSEYITFKKVNTS